MRKLGTKKLLESSFSGQFSGSSRRPKNFEQKENFSGRWAILACLLIVFLLFILARLFDLQIIEGPYYKTLAEGNRIRRVPIKAPRGEILDRNNKPLARNIPVYKLAEFTESGVVKSTEMISREKAIEIQTSDSEDASRLLVDTGREYPLNEIAAHLVGFVNETTQPEIGQTAPCQEQVKNYLEPLELGDLIGRMGVEQQYDCLLRGINGEELIEVDARGRLVRRLGRREPIPGNAIKLSIDSELQAASYEALLAAPDEKGLGPRRDKGEIVKGGLVAQNPQTGEVLALVSSPSYNPNVFGEKYQEYAQDPNLPFFNRAIGGAFPPGSTFKLVTSIAGVETGVLNQDFKYTDVGFVEAGGTRFRNWLYTRNGGTEGEINVVRAIQRSTDTFFYIAGEKIGIEKLAEWGQKLGLGKVSGIDLPHEAAGIMPTPEWKQEIKGERWFLGNTYNTSIGQGDVTATSLQINRLTSAVANNGKLCTPYIASEKQQYCPEIGISSEGLRLTRDGMIGACSPGGTSGQFLNFKVQVACKTGTAEVGNDNTHAWFTAFGPVDNPSVSVTTIIEEGGEGSVVAAPVVKKVFEKYFAEKPL